MGYSLKMTGLTKAKGMLDDYKKLINETVDGLNSEVRLPLPKNEVDLVITGLDKAQKPFNILQKQIKKAHVKAVRLMADEFSKALDDAMESSVWDWKGDKRDIIDTGELKNSKKIIVDSDGDIHIFYGTDYAAIVHYGGYFYPYGNQNAKTFYPGRPWVTALIEGGGPVNQFDFGRVYGTFLISELNNII